MSEDVFTDMIEDEPELINNMTTPSFTLDALLSGQHDDLLRELAAKSVGWHYHGSPEMSQVAWMCWSRPGNPEWRTEPPPNFPTSLDACRELVSALTDEERPLFDKRLEWFVDHCGYAWDVEPLHFLIAFCLTRNLIRLVEQ